MVQALALHSTHELVLGTIENLHELQFSARKCHGRQARNILYLEELDCILVAFENVPEAAPSEETEGGERLVLFRKSNFAELEHKILTPHEIVGGLA